VIQLTTVMSLPVTGSGKSFYLYNRPPMSYLLTYLHFHDVPKSFKQLATEHIQSAIVLNIQQCIRWLSQSLSVILKGLKFFCYLCTCPQYVCLAHCDITFTNHQRFLGEISIWKNFQLFSRCLPYLNSCRPAVGRWARSGYGRLIRLVASTK
jgi:hypothetical protein